MKRNLLIAMLLLVAGLQSAWGQKMIVTLDDDSKVEYDITRVKEVTFVETAPEEQHEWVDLGLPSGTLWATCNVGASSPEEYGDYFAWGETVQREDYTPAAYAYNNIMETITAYNAQSDDRCLLPEYDAATANWGDDWQMPSAKQFEELINDTYTTMEWTTQNGVFGRKITSRSNGNSIFLPAAGYLWSDIVSVEGKGGEYWSRSLNTTNTGTAYYLYFRESIFLMDFTGGHFGRSVRPVIPGTNSVQFVTDITLNYTSLRLQLNGTETLTATVLPDDADNKEVAWTSSDEAVATVSTDGLVTGVAAGSCVITCSAIDGSGVKTECQVKVKGPDTLEYVDLGLPSGTLWATCNVGASSPEEYGDYFAWGETEPKDGYSWETYKWCNGPNHSITKYCQDSDNGYNGFTDTLTELLPEDDAATANWGSGWQMPSLAQMEELTNSSYTTTEWTTRNGVNGRLVTSKSNSNSIFLPAAGYRYGTSLGSAGSFGDYFSRSLGGDESYSAYHLAFYSSDISCHYGSRRSGFSVRPVRVRGFYTVNGVSFKMIPVEGGTFQMGSDDSDAWDWEKPVHQVTLSSFSIGETEVTQALWYAVMGAKPTSSKSWSADYGLGDNYPAYYVSWDDCQTFIGKLNELTGQTFRLPTEAEWEYAARGGNKSNGYTYSGSNTIGDVAWYWDNSNTMTHDVATKAPNELGIYDMSGNVYEWCQDWLDDYSSGSQTNPTGPSSGSNRVVRGGSWYYYARDGRVSGRGSYTPSYSSNYLGFRLAQ